MPDASGPITSTPSQDWQPYDATSDDTLAGWDKVESGPCDDDSFTCSGTDWPDSGLWRQT